MNEWNQELKNFSKFYGPKEIENGLNADGYHLSQSVMQPYNNKS